MWVSRPESPACPTWGPERVSRRVCRARTLPGTGLQWLVRNHQAVSCTVTALLDRDKRKVPESG